jgi:hypothetical protein
MSLAGIGEAAETLVVEQIAREPDLAVLLLKLSQVSKSEILIHMKASDDTRVISAEPPKG